jgi:hypothetical protein
VVEVSKDRKMFTSYVPCEVVGKFAEDTAASLERPAYGRAGVDFLRHRMRATSPGEGGLVLGEESHSHP